MIWTIANRRIDVEYTNVNGVVTFTSSSVKPKVSVSDPDAKVAREKFLEKIRDAIG